MIRKIIKVPNHVYRKLKVECSLEEFLEMEVNKVIRKIIKVTIHRKLKVQEELFDNKLESNFILKYVFIKLQDL